jgi:hypothetical protein
MEVVRDLCKSVVQATSDPRSSVLSRPAVQFGVGPDDCPREIQGRDVRILVDDGTSDLSIGDGGVGEDDALLDRHVLQSCVRHDLDALAQRGVFEVGIAVDIAVAVEVPVNRVEVALRRPDVEPGLVEGERVNGLTVLEPLDEPAGLVGVVVAREVRLEERERLGGEAVAGDGDERTLRVVGLLLEVDDLCVVVQFEEAVRGGVLVGLDVVGGECGFVVGLEGVEEVGDVERDEVVTRDDERVLGQAFSFDEQ